MRQPVNKPWKTSDGTMAFRDDERCAPGVLIFFDDSELPVLIGDINRLGGVCDDCESVGEVVRELIDLRSMISGQVSK